MLLYKEDKHEVHEIHKMTNKVKDMENELKDKERRLKVLEARYASKKQKQFPCQSISNQVRYSLMVTDEQY